MTAYILRRLLYTIPIVFGVILILFCLFNIVPGNPARVKLGKNATTKAVRDLEHQLKIDLPLIANLDAATADAWRTDTRAHITVLATSGQPVPGVGLIPVAVQDDAYWFMQNYRHVVPPLLELLHDATAPDVERDWASWALAHTTGEPLHWRTTAPEADRRRILASWAEWEARRADHPALNPSWTNVFHSQFFHFLWDALTFNFGKSLNSKQYITDIIWRGAPASLAVTVPGFFLGLIVSMTIALLCAFWRGGWIDRSFVVISVLSMSIASLAYVILGQYFFSYWIRLFPIQGFRPPYVNYVALPVLIFVAFRLGPNVRFFRTVMLDEVNQDYVRTARAKGLSSRAVMLRHVLKNAMIPVITYVVIAIPFLYLGSLLLERFFGIPGLGSIMVDAIFSADWPVVRAFTYIGALLYILGNLATDICYALVDPRVQLG